MPCGQLLEHPVLASLLRDVIITRGEEQFHATCRMQTRVAWYNPDTELQVGDVITYGESTLEITKVAGRPIAPTARELPSETRPS
jgi:hypothetical protein